MTTVHKMPTYFYDDCTVINWVDGDTLDMVCRAHFDMGFGVIVSGQYTGRFRLRDINAYEKRDIPLGPAATAFAEGAMPPGSSVQTETFKDPDNFGRYLARIWLPGSLVPINAQLLDAKLAVPYEGRIR